MCNDFFKDEKEDKAFKDKIDLFDRLIYFTYSQR